MKKFFVLSVFLSFALVGGVEGQDAPDLVNLDHLRFLTEQVTVSAQTMAIVHIYSEAPDYEWVDAAGEGISAVDDVARAAVVYLWQYERTGDAALLELARSCLEFVRYMQLENGEFYNFIYDRTGTINETGNTSYSSLGWWAMRGFWALGEGVRVFQNVDAEYADTLAEAYLRTETALGATLANYGQMNTLHGFDIPAWLPGSETAISGIALLGLAAYYQARPNEATADIMTHIADGIAQYRLGDHSSYPFGMHPVQANAPGFWHAWGAHAEHGLVMAGVALNRQDWIDSAAASANSFLLRLLAFEPIRNMGNLPDRLGQIAYGTNMLVQTYAALYRATGEEQYARYAGLAASWYFGNNMANTQMYTPETGRVFDGINGPVAWRVNRNAGAESTIEGLMSMIAIADMPLALAYVHVTPAGGNGYQIVQAEDGQRVVGTPVYYTGDWTGEGYISGGRYIGLGEGQRMRIAFAVPEDDDYLVYAAQLRQAANSNAFTVQRSESTPTIDGDLSDWSDEIPALASERQQQLLRGGGIWRGAEVDSHRVRLTWDDTHLYIAAEVRDPEHEQPFTLSTVWQADALWFYMTNDPDARRLSAKFTFAQTPDGPQVWDWLHTEFLQGAQMTWQAAGDGGYVYEAALTWESLGVEQPSAGMRIGLEVGRGIGGNSFMDLTGRDPDVPANLLQLVLVTPDTNLSDSTTPDIFLDVRVDDGESTLLPQSVSPDSDYFWLDLATAQPVHLTAGDHLLRYGYADSGGESDNPGLAKVDAFLIQPVTARRVYTLEDGRRLTLTYNTLTGETTWAEG
ncbi:MAG: sugar-binding protein [Anaerolineae bacterium]